MCYPTPFTNNCRARFAVGTNAQDRASGCCNKLRAPHWQAAVSISSLHTLPVSCVLPTPRCDNHYSPSSLPPLRADVYEAIQDQYIVAFKPNVDAASATNR
jgi:hypothetical protein